MLRKDNVWVMVVRILLLVCKTVLLCACGDDKRIRLCALTASLCLDRRIRRVGEPLLRCRRLRMRFWFGSLRCLCSECEITVLT